MESTELNDILLILDKLFDLFLDRCEFKDQIVAELQAIEARTGRPYNRDERNAVLKRVLGEPLQIEVV